LAGVSTPPPPLDAIDSDLRAQWTATGVTLDAGAHGTSGTLGRSAHDDIAQTVLSPEEARVWQNSTEIEVGAEIGRGGHAVVRTGEQVALRRTVAVKIPRSSDAALTAALLREAWVASSLEHPNILPIHALSQDQAGLPLLVMKRIHGVSWSDALANPRLIPGAFPTDVLEWHLRALIQLCRAVEFAHSRGVLHLDIKPSNVMLGAHGEVYLLDWGLAVTTRSDAPDWFPRASAIRRVLGTPAFLSPEQARGDGTAFNHTTDVYLLGAVLYAIVNGRALRETAPIAAVTHAWRGEIPAFEPRVSADLEALCRTALAREQADRFQSVQAFRNALEGFLRHRGAKALAHRVLIRLPMVLADPFADPRAMHEARFGLQQALEAWPGNTAAAQGLQRLLVGISEAHLARGEVDAAAAILPELPEPDAQLEARIEALRAQQQRDAEEVETLRRAQDLTVNRSSRNVWLFGLGLLWLLSNLTTGYLNRSGIFPIDFLALTLMSLGTLACFATGVWMVRTTLWQTEIDRRMIKVIGGGLATAPFLWLIAARSGLDTAHAMSLSTVLYMLFAAAQAAHLERGIGWLALSLAPLVALAGWMPEYGYEWAGVAGLISAWVPLLIWRRA
jgi:serine/threonine-protein kinase